MKDKRTNPEESNRMSDVMLGIAALFVLYLVGDNWFFQYLPDLSIEGLGQLGRNLMAID